mmetsp:Transcript_98897/g.171371  ORF Transcript_98897/g.171371 Transcript_98897/m.171371 type:complete len:94 (-) Transcript_98897:779-1060(-)
MAAEGIQSIVELCESGVMSLESIQAFVEFRKSGPMCVKSIQSVVEFCQSGVVGAKGIPASIRNVLMRGQLAEFPVQLQNSCLTGQHVSSHLLM